MVCSGAGDRRRNGAYFPRSDWINVRLAPLPDNESERLAALARYQILDTEPEQAFDDLTHLAAQICGTPIALVSLIDADRQWFKSRLGVSFCETSRDIAFCSHTILESDVLIVPDATRDPRFADNPMVQEQGIRFYAGAPLRTPNGFAVGVMCVKDTVPRHLTENQIESLRRLARQAVTQLELRRAFFEQEAGEAELRASLNQLETLIALSPVGLELCEMDGTKINVNDAYLRIVGHTREETFGVSYWDLTPKEYEPAEKELLRQLAETGRYGPYEKEYLHKDGHRVPVRLNGVRYTDADGQQRIWSVIEDVTEARNRRTGAEGIEGNPRIPDRGRARWHRHVR